ncbi:glutathione S-transferase family protein [Thalassobius sp. Cn5-15]|uniref:glutathione S-transferase family protein n=1 Tax=Thalassobius sp. Cn5-15 TaxID=2917763 RepID=UPI001EF1F9FE|nr:glutathione S-transferase family protein [Thalassobius sp. Cn5-15]MCG7492678.1 glutathione S-transferase family protein [Thalassobius sp. Cn5-15]
MPTLYHSPNSRSSRVIAQLMLMGKLDAVEVVIVDVPRHDGTGCRDPRNPHPEGKVPYLITDDGVGIRESAAIMIYLDEVFDQPFSPKLGEATRGAYLSWMVYSAGVLEPVLVAAFSGLDHPALAETFRGMSEVAAELESALHTAPYLLGHTLSVADILMASPFQWAPHLMPESALIRDWVSRVGAQVDGDALAAFETEGGKQIAAKDMP